MSSRWVSKPPVGAQIEWGHPLSKGLVGCWLMNEGGGNVVNDSARGKRGILTTTDMWKPHGVDFLNTNRQISLGTPGYMSSVSGARTITALCYIRSSGGTSQVVFGTSDATNAKTVCFFNNATMRFFVDAGSARQSSTTFPFNKWFLVTWCWNGLATGEVAKIYLDGKEVAYSDTFTITSITDDSAFPLTIGNGLNYQRDLDGKIAFVYYHNRVLSPSEIQSLYESPYQFVRGPSTITYFTPPAAGGWTWGGEVKNVMVA